MKFFEFNNYGYFALIGARNQKTAEKYYREVVADILEGDGPPDEVTKDEARDRYIKACSCGGSKAYRDFNKNARSLKPCLFIIDGSLI